MGKSSINGPFSMAMLNNQRVLYGENMGKHPFQFKTYSPQELSFIEMQSHLPKQN